jgi:hypothetical protein
MSKMKIALFALIGLLVAVGGGWLWGSSGRWAAERQAQGAELRVQLAEARASLLSARVNLFEINFGKASTELERAKQAMSAAADLLDKAGRSGDAASVREALAKGSEAQRLAGSVDQTASARAAEALAALARVGATEGGQ